MSSLGRGRGFVRSEQPPVAREQLRRPAEAAQWHSPLEQLAARVTCLDLQSRQQLLELQQDIEAYCTGMEKLKLLIDDLHERALAERKFGVRAAAALATCALLTVQQLKLRAVLIKNLQNDFASHEMTRSSNKPRFLNAVAFLGEVFHRVKLTNNAPIAVLASAHAAYQKALIEGDEAELELCIQLLCLNGCELRKCDSSLVEEVILAMHKRLLSVDCDARCRGWLLLGIQLHHHQYAVLPDAYWALYKVALGPKALASVATLLGPDRDQPGPEQGPSKVPVKEDRPQKVLNEGYGDGYHSRRNEKSRPRVRMEDPNWLPKPARLEEDIRKWGLGAPGQSGGHDDRWDRGDFYTNPQNKGPTQQPLPNAEDWDD